MTASCVICPVRPPRAARPGRNACPDCTGELWRLLDELATLVPLLRGLLEPGSNQHASAKVADVSAAPLNVGVLALLDARGDLSVNGVLAPYWRQIAALKRLTAGQDPIRGLRTHIDTVTAQDWLEDCAYDVRRLHREVMRACGETTSRVARCPKTVDHDTGRECGGPIVAAPSSRVAVCTRCGDEWPRARWALLGRLQS
jgi:hypothetical protein